MKLSEAKPCANCDRPVLNRPMTGHWYVLRVSSAMVNRRAARGVLGLTQLWDDPEGRMLKIAEAMAPEGDKAITIMGDEEPGLMTEIHVCFDCAAGFRLMRPICELLEKLNRRASEDDAASSLATGEPPDEARATALDCSTTKLTGETA